MDEQKGFTGPDDAGTESALGEAEGIINAAAAEIAEEAQQDGGAQDGGAPDGEGAQPDAAAAADTPESVEAQAADLLSEAQAKAAEHLADLQRLQAEFVNYRKRVDRDRGLAAEVTTARVIEALIPVLDDIAAAREHGDLAEGPFASIAEKLEATLAKLGWSSFGAVGEAFDPTLHDALTSTPSADVTEPQIATVVQLGHRVGERVLRPARVVVAQPE